MSTKKNRKFNICSILLAVSLVCLLGLVAFQAQQNSVLNRDLDGIATIEVVSSGVQRIAKLELEGSNDSNLMAELETSILTLASKDGESIYFTGSEEITELLQTYTNEFSAFFNVVAMYRVDGNRDSLFVASEYHYVLSEQLIQLISAYNAHTASTITTVKLALIVNAAVILLFLAKILLNTRTELQKNKQLSKEIYIDASTGVYNRAKCQEILKMPPQEDVLGERAIVIFDLNDLKKTNDSLGHRAGDDLIFSFAHQLKEAVHVVSPDLFVGRYGGDEFIAFFESTVAEDVERYLKKVDDLILQFNESQNKPFTLSCAAGYAITSEETRMVTTRELFDVADANMYENKMMMKARKRQEEAAKEIEEAKLSMTSVESDLAKNKA